MNPIRVLHLSSSEVFGGNEEHIRVCAKYAAQEKCKVIVACPEGDFSDVLQKENIQSFPLTMTSKFSLACAARIAKLVKKNHVDIVHSHNRRTDYFAFLSSFLCNPRAFVTTVHDRVDAGSSLSLFLHAWLLRSFFKKIYCVSQKTREQVLAFSRCAPHKAFAITNGTDINKLDLAVDVNAKKKELGIPPDKKVVGMLARMRDANFEKKAHPLFLRAAGEVLKKRDDVLFVVAGEEEKPRRALQKLCDALGIRNHVLFLGPRKNDSLEVMACYNIFVLPSSYEGMPRSLSEAMGLGKAVVATQVDGVPELVKDGENGKLVPPENAHEMAEAVLFFLENQKRAEAFGARAREHIFSNFGHAQMVSQIESVYKELVCYP